MWLVAHNKCWTADRLAKRGQLHPDRYPLCDQEAELINHLTVTCVFACQFWFRLLQKVALHSLSLQPGELSFDDW